MQLKFSKEMTKEEFLTLLSSFLEKWVNNSSTQLVIKEMKIGLVVDGKECDISQDGVEAVFTLFNEYEENSAPSKFEEKTPKNEVPLLQYDTLSKWMFAKSKSCNIPPGIEKELEYVGETLPYSSNEEFPVYSIESYCSKRGIKFLKTNDYKYIQKSIAAELISPDSINQLETSAIYLDEQGLSEGIKIDDLEKVFGEPIRIYGRSNGDSSSYVTKENIRNMRKFLRFIKPFGKEYRFSKGFYEGEYFEDTYNLNQLMEENKLIVISHDEYNEEHYVNYLSGYDFNNFPKEMNIKEKAIVYGGVIENSNRTIQIKPFYKIEQVLNDYSKFICEGNLKKDHLRCPIRFLYKLKKVINKETDINFNNLSPIGLTRQNHLVFENIPIHAKEKIEQYIMLKEKEDEINKIKMRIEI
ncbi:hypothetical protein AB3H50_10900 [Bacillus pacificus]|nr:MULTISPECIES: hypothetical protein [Bacillus cereus group]ASI77710.1 hypothetical protein BA202_10840 [Bacillus cereus]MDA1606229.1 hypothetical protein [Bacillus cereus group sp. TH208-1LC]PGM61590.1 hypothetical protein CN950_25530 [Bacillus cereus]